ncbi:hypothetical protein RhiJN_05113 [Ceratobasidium sp. AG-Ba]|nr:hypothetical protein RhiJN_05113 [Ceratobasidium sp. AG-Ba]QRW06039.1 hypothetical protein RhiLY_05038 [Ceratobasidium sp. AG-Ba]
MPEFTQASANKLAGIPWSLKTTTSPDSSGRETCYFFKFISDMAENTCCFMITDTISVWAEVLDSKHTSHRARHAHSARGSSKRGFALPYHDVDEESDWRRGVVRTLGEVHENAMDGGVEFEVKNSEVADLSVYLSDTLRDFHWRWDVMSVGRIAAPILSRQLFMPMVTLATVMSNLSQSIEDASEASLKTIAERKASTAKVMPAHHLRGFLSRPAVQTTLKYIAEVDGAPSLSGYEQPAAKLVSTPSIDMADPPDGSGSRGLGSVIRPAADSSGESLGRFDGFGSARKGKGRDDTDDEDEGSVRKMRRGVTPRRSDIRATLSNETPTLRRSSFPRSRLDPDSTATEAETTRRSDAIGGNNSYSQTMDEDIGPPAAASSQPPPAPSPSLMSPRPSRPSPRDKVARAASRSPVDNSDVFGGAETQTQGSSDDSDREAELERRVRAAGMIGSAAVRTPAGGGLGSRMIRKKF